MAEEGDSSANQAVHLIFAQASAKPPEELEAFLEQACGGDARLRRQVEEMLAEAGDEDEGDEGDDEGSQAPEQGETIAGYDVIRQIGQGGMGVVYLARDPQLHRQVALKLLQFGSMPHPDAVARFQQEMRAVAQLSHPNIVTAYHASEHDGNQILVMEFVPGSDLATLVKEQGPVPEEQAIEWVLQAARGLQNAHEAGIVHRDIKPANLLLDETGTVKILDLGLARIETADAGEGLTQSGMVMGSVDYMAPEQASEARDADQRADIYSLGCTLYYLLKGRPAYKGDSLFLKIQAHMDQPIPPLSDDGSQMSTKLEAVFRRMLSKSPEERQQTMAEVIADLEACLPKLGEDQDEAPKRSSAVAMLTVAGIAIAVAITAYFLLWPEAAVTVDAQGFVLKAPPRAGSAHLTDSGQRLGSEGTTEVELGDLDGDGDLDVVVANYYEAVDLVWINDGSGRFVSGTALGQGMATSLELGDLDEDGDLDAIVAERNTADSVWLNDGEGRFAPHGEGLATKMARNISLGDLNGDGHLDAVVASGGTGTRIPNTVWFGDGHAGFVMSDQMIEAHATWEASLGDLDGDGDLDVVFGNGDTKGADPLEPNTVWMNDGQGNFEDSAQQLGAAFTRDVVLGDLDNDGDLDAVFANAGGESSQVWFNDGAGRFELVDAQLGIGEERSAILADLDADGDLDLVLSGETTKNVRWINDGRGGFSDPVSFGAEDHYGVGDAGDLDGDGDWDLFLQRTFGRSNEVWLNEPPADVSEDP